MEREKKNEQKKIIFILEQSGYMSTSLKTYNI